MNAYDVVVIGGGAAGLNAALVLGRARRRVAVVDAGEPRNAPAAHMQGFLSRDGMPPAELLSVGRAEVAGYGVDLVDGRVAGIEPGFAVRLTDGTTLGARRIVVATGLRDELPEVPGVAERWGRDVIHCPYCHGWEVRDQAIGVLAGEARSVHQAVMVKQWSDDVVFFAHEYALTAEDRQQLDARRIPVVEGPVARLVVADDVIRGVELRGGRVVERSAIFVAPRFVPIDGLLRELGCEVDNGLVKVDQFGRTTVDGVWAVGNVVTPMASVVMAAAAGAAAAMVVNGDLVEEEVSAARIAG
ncbi:MAG: NAD(P)/FAD-dependent oxidoreductase [Hamadaea sp.]|uniref:NAD(P)/FAD-dependent oxidoreductase n=1 Tax=Hamadaea sp. TaxID=2024425 RepID=UPI00180147A0|nr:NAD(P)/FAD-dependent oxidoreductase [Hamadaea sp.]NUR74504.1 NAD(P)/FAD-dependent oxidoreductase [Hamadaea sp.]NUT21433.1 NAD(P)/FAD-dependent oxidoreductase [Hamadaea sp.]